MSFVRRVERSGPSPGGVHIGWLKKALIGVFLKKKVSRLEPPKKKISCFSRYKDFCRIFGLKTNFSIYEKERGKPLSDCSWGNPFANFVLRSECGLKLPFSTSLGDDSHN